MKTSAYKRYKEESSLWLHQGRRRLIQGLLGRFLPESELQLLEVGAGVGQNIEILSNYGHVDALEKNEIGLAYLKEDPHVREIFPISIPAVLPRCYDVIGAFDVIEHIENDRQVVAWIFDHLNSGGLFIATVPSYSWLFTDHDRSLGHYRRYSLPEVLALMPSGSKVVASSYFNTILFPLAASGRFLWQLKQTILKRACEEKQKVPSNRLIGRVFDKILTAEADLVRRGWRLPFGLSIVVCVRKSTQ